MSSDIPVGSPPVPPGRHAAPGGWYPDPVDASRERYWDGWQWSRNTRPAERPAQPAAPVPAAGPVPRPPAGAVPPGGAVPPAATAGSAVLHTADGVPVSGWWMRVLAAVLDYVIITVIASLLSIPIYLRMVPALSRLFQESMRAAEEGRMMPMADPNQLLAPADQLQVTLIALGVGLLYHGVFLRWRGATPGKLICGLRVVPVDQGRHTGGLSWRAVVPRTVIWVLPGAAAVLLIFQLVDVLLPLGHPKRQAIHDLAAATQVIRTV